MCLTRTTLQSGGRAIQRTRRGPPRRDRGRETEEEQDLRNERIGDLFILPILLWLRAETAQCTEEEQDLRNDRMWCVRDPGV